MVINPFLFKSKVILKAALDANQRAVPLTEELQKYSLGINPEMLPKKMDFFRFSSKLVKKENLFNAVKRNSRLVKGTCIWFVVGFASVWFLELAFALFLMIKTRLKDQSGIHTA